MPISQPFRFILASASPRRRELLTQTGVNFDVVVADIVEHEDPTTDPREMVAHNSALKANWVAQKFPDAWVLGADTTVFIDGSALNKPGNRAEAEEMLKRLSGRTHTVFTGLAFRHHHLGRSIDRGVASEVTFHPLTDEIIQAYLSKVHTLDKAGGYAIQECGEMIVARQIGSFSNIVGLPLEETKQILTEVGLMN
jgi:septum formation protein